RRQRRQGMGENRLFSLLVFGINSAMAFTACGEDAPELTESQRVAEAARADAPTISEAKRYIDLPELPST
ncbi:MAG: hypothetical protein CL702_02430, partial [Chloroflexi bacterium]|nr:hypothetical protein [Chloroflexota bacterium]